MTKITPTMQRALDALPFEYSVWGGRHFGGLPKGVSLATIRALHDRELIRLIKTAHGHYKAVRK